MASSSQVNFNAPHKPHENAIRAFKAVEKPMSVVEEIIASRKDWDRHEPRMWSRASGVTDHDLAGKIDFDKDLVLVRSGATSYGTIILGKIRVGTNDGRPGYVHVRIHDPPNEGIQDVMFHSIWTNEADPDEEGRPQRWEAIQELDTPLEFFNE